jgi:surface antigen
MANIGASICFTAAIAILTMTTPASAQINPFGRYEQPITDDDLKLIEAASTKLYKTDNPQVGASEKWSNPSTGNAGTVTLTQIYEKDGMPCRKLRHRITAKGDKDPTVYIFSRCRVKSGEWKLL